MSPLARNLTNQNKSNKYFVRFEKICMISYIMFYFIVVHDYIVISERL